MKKPIVFNVQGLVFNCYVTGHTSKRPKKETTDTNQRETDLYTPTQTSANVDKYRISLWNEDDREIYRAHHPSNSKPRKRFRVKGKKPFRGTITRKQMLREKWQLREIQESADIIPALEAISKKLIAEAKKAKEEYDRINY